MTYQVAVLLFLTLIMLLFKLDILKIVAAF